ncbi:MAG: hypothetical protein AAGN66_23025 [Acidobacteriota bacterium]
MTPAQRSGPCILGAILIVVFTLAPAGAAEGPWTLRVQARAVDSSAALFVDDDLGVSEGVDLQIEYRASDRLGIALGVSSTQLEQSDETSLAFPQLPIGPFVPIGPSPLSARVTAETRITPLTLGALVHLTPGRRADVWIGPVIGWAQVDDLEIRTELSGFGFPGVVLPGIEIPGFDTSVSLEADDAFVYGARLGVDVPFGRSGTWLLTASLEYLALEIDVDVAGAGTGAGIDLDPLALGAGVAVGF